MNKAVTIDTSLRRYARSLLMLAVASVSQFGRPASAGVGDLLLTVDIPPAAQCSSGLSTSIAMVPGSALGFPNTRMLLVTSCFGSTAQGGNVLYFLDLATNPATLVRTITTNPTPGLGWGALAYRGDKADIIACGNEANGTHAVYAINITPFDGTANDGNGTFLFDAAPGFSICDGIAWDTADNTVFQSPDVSNTIDAFDEVGFPLLSLASPSGCPNSGVAVGGSSLFAACNGVLRIHQMNKTNGSVFTTFNTAGQRTEDLECDPGISDSVDAMWSKDAFTNQAFAFEIPEGTCGFAGGPPVVPATCPDGSTDDTDGDGLLDCWETNGIDFDGNGTVDLQLYDLNGDGMIDASEEADPNHKDIFIEIDWMALHQPNGDAIADVITAFANAPVTNPDGTTGIRLHVLIDEQALAHNNDFAFEPCTRPAGGGVPDFDATKQAWFGTSSERSAANSVNVLNAKRFVFHYNLWVHSLLGLHRTSGCAELPGNDFVTSLGGWASVGGHAQGNRGQQNGTFMHELGHNLNLRHGGDENTNCKPNYLSVMTYTRQIDNNPIISRALDYSRSVLPPLSESSLNEPAGIGGPSGRRTAFGPTPVAVVTASASIDWNRDGDTSDTSVSADINSGWGGCRAQPGQTLTGHDDWTNLVYDFRQTVDFADGVHQSVLEADEQTFEEALEASPDTDGDGIVNLVDNCPVDPNPEQADGDANGVGDACEPVTGLYRGRNGNPARGEDPVLIFIERNVELASQELGFSDYDPDGDGWSVVGRTTDATDGGPLARFWIEDGLPVAATRHPTKGCLSVTPTKLDEVRAGQNRRVTQERNSDNCRSAPPEADVDGDGVPDNQQPMYTLRDNGSQLFLDRSTAAAEAQLGVSDWDPDGDGQALFAQTTNARQYGRFVDLTVDAHGGATVRVEHPTRGCQVLKPNLAPTTPVAAGQNRRFKIIQRTQRACD